MLAPSCTPSPLPNAMSLCCGCVFVMATSSSGGEGGSVRVPFEAFRDYYASLSAAVDDDSFFTLMLFNAWDLAGGLTHATARSRGGRQHSTTGRAPAPGSGLKQRGHHPAGIGFGATSIYHR